MHIVWKFGTIYTIKSLQNKIFLRYKTVQFSFRAKLITFGAMNPTDVKRVPAHRLYRNYQTLYAQSIIQNN